MGTRCGRAEQHACGATALEKAAANSPCDGEGEPRGFLFVCLRSRAVVTLLDLALSEIVQSQDRN